jgi:hypothetical protein
MCTAPIIRAMSDVVMMEAVQTSETSVNLYMSIRRYNPEDSHLRKSFDRNTFFHSHNIIDGICVSSATHSILFSL